MSHLNRDPESDWLPHCIRCDGRHTRQEPCVTNFIVVGIQSPQGGLMKLDAMANVNRQKLSRPVAKMLEHIEDARLHLIQSDLSEPRKVELDGVLQHAMILIDDAVRT